MIIMMVSMMIMMKSEVWKRRLRFLHLLAPECDDNTDEDDNNYNDYDHDNNDDDLDDNYDGVNDDHDEE